jgi:transmembrane sensor
VNLDDGSSVQLDVGTRIEVRMSGDSRGIQLLSGRALFEVARDSSRPFSVTAAGSRTTALGTKFQVERTDTNVIVTLTEGSVAVDQYQNHLVGIGWNERLVPGEQISIDIQNHRSLRRLVDIHSTTSWTQGRHIFRGMPLKAAIEEVNRYAETKVRIGDPSLATLPVAGNFIVGDSEIVVEALAAVLPVRAVSNANQEIVLFRSYSR